MLNDPSTTTFPFNTDLAIEHLRRDKPLARLIDQIGPFRMQLNSTHNLFLALARAIVYQQLHGKAAASIFARVSALLTANDAQSMAAQLLRFSDEELRAVGLSRNKLLALRDLAQRTVSGELLTLEQIHVMENEAIIASLTQVRGIGRWTVEMLLMFRLGRPDVLPLDDFGIRKGFAYAFKKQPPILRAELEKRGLRWRPYRTVASWYLWRAAELPQG
jgi:3-methyladenine DNA glycosylase/8-oxoguanine DNA glycosylase